MARDQERASAEGFCIQVLIINGEIQNHLSQKSFYIENIGKGGFRFISDVEFELEDRVQVLLRFPDEHEFIAIWMEYWNEEMLDLME